jgi:hypothetical protein
MKDSLKRTGQILGGIGIGLVVILIILMGIVGAISTAAAQEPTTIMMLSKSADECKFNKKNDQFESEKHFVTETLIVVKNKTITFTNMDNKSEKVVFAIEKLAYNPTGGPTVFEVKAKGSKIKWIGVYYDKTSGIPIDIRASRKSFNRMINYTIDTFQWE